MQQQEEEQQLLLDAAHERMNTLNAALCELGIPPLGFSRLATAGTLLKVAFIHYDGVVEQIDVRRVPSSSSTTTFQSLLPEEGQEKEERVEFVSIALSVQMHRVEQCHEISLRFPFTMLRRREDVFCKLPLGKLLRQGLERVGITTFSPAAGDRLGFATDSTDASWWPPCVVMAIMRGGGGNSH